MKTIHASVLLAVVLLNITACRKQNEVRQLPAASEENSQVSAAKSAGMLNPSDFVTDIDNPYFPLKPGTIRFYINKTKDGSNTIIENITLTVTKDIKTILGVACIVVHDQVKADGKVTEDTYDWYAQDKEGNVWYFGEATRKRTDTGWSTVGSWEAGVDNAKQGIIMYAKPPAHLGETYYQEYLQGFAEDQAKLVNANATVTIGLGTYMHCVQSREFTRLDPGNIARKTYAPGLGEIKAEHIKGGYELEELAGIINP